MSNIVITDLFYVNYSIRNESEWNAATQKYDSKKTRLGFATYYEENTAFQKRKGTIDRWSDKADAADTVANAARTGYTLGNNVTHGGDWNATSVNWRIVDPLGFELEISSGNMAKILQHCTIDKGMILDECVWGWDKGNGSKVVLVPTASQEYQEAKKTTVRHFAETISVKDVQLGDMVEYKNGAMGLYFGKVNVLNIERGISFTEPLGSMGMDQYHVMLTDDNVIYFMKSPKLIACSKSSKRYTVEEAEVYLNQCFNDKKWTRNAAGWSGNFYSANIITYDKKPETKMHLVPVTTAYLRSALRDPYKHPGSMIHGYDLQMPDNKYVVEDASGKRYIMGYLVHEILGSGRRHKETEDFYEGRSDDLELYVVPIANNNYLDANVGLIPEKNPKYNPNSYYDRGNQENRVVMKLSEIVNVFKVEVTHKDYVATLKTR